MDVDRITILYPSLPISFFVPIHNSQLFEIKARLKLVSVPFSSLLLDISHLEKRFPRHVRKFRTSIFLLFKFIKFRSKHFESSGSFLTSGILVG